MPKNFVPALACTLAALGWAAAASANPAPHPVQHPAPTDGDHKPDDAHKDAKPVAGDHHESGDHHQESEKPKGH